MRNGQRRARMSAVALAYRALIIDVLDKPPVLSKAERLSMCAALAKPRHDDPRVIGDLFDPPKQGR